MADFICRLARWACSDSHECRELARNLTYARFNNTGVSWKLFTHYGDSVKELAREVASLAG